MTSLLWYKEETLRKLLCGCVYDRVCTFVQETSQEILNEVDAERFGRYDVVALKRFASGVLFNQMRRFDVDHKRDRLAYILYVFFQICRKLTRTDQETVCWNFNQTRIRR